MCRPDRSFFFWGTARSSPRVPALAAEAETCVAQFRMEEEEAEGEAFDRFDLAWSEGAEDDKTVMTAEVSDDPPSPSLLPPDDDEEDPYSSSSSLDPLEEAEASYPPSDPLPLPLLELLPQLLPPPSTPTPALEPAPTTTLRAMAMAMSAGSAAGKTLASVVAAGEGGRGAERGRGRGRADGRVIVVIGGTTEVPLSSRRVGKGAVRRPLGPWGRILLSEVGGSGGGWRKAPDPGPSAIRPSPCPVPRMPAGTARAAAAADAVGTAPRGFR